ncbi:MAG: DUF3253 domain-containing protein [Pacificimonas sp.]|jgi:hypothetical protein|nr:DUF3253 domain-containing protein [Pacificimonas sp.]
MASTASIEAELLALAAERGPDRTFCPSEAARRLVGDQEEAAWRALMPTIRAVAADLTAAGTLVCTQKGAPAHPVDAKGPIRLAVPPAEKA